MRTRGPAPAWWPMLLLLMLGPAPAGAQARDSEDGDHEGLAFAFPPEEDGPAEAAPHVPTAPFHRCSKVRASVSPSARQKDPALGPARCGVGPEGRAGERGSGAGAEGLWVLGRDWCPGH